MKNKIISIITTSTLILLCFFNVTNAQTTNYPHSEEAILNFDSSVNVNTDNSVDVQETISYDTGPLQRHGIYRDIYPYSSVNSKMGIENISVVDENNQPYIFTISTSGQNFRLKIGDPNQTFNGQKVYIIKYHATRAVAQYKDFDEIYWNATGNEWNIPIYQASVSVTLPTGASLLQSSCYYGLKGSKNQCQLADKQYGIYKFNSPTSLNAGEGLTVAVGFPKGVVGAYGTADAVSDFFNTYFGWLLVSLLPILTLIFSLIYWYKKGRDPKGAGVIVPQYDVPDGLTPMEVIGIVGEKVYPEYISAEIIYLATKGYLKIKELEKQKLSFFDSIDYELTKLKDPADLPSEFDRTLFWGLFGKTLINPEVQTVKLSELKNVFYKNVPVMISSVADTLLKKGYYKNLGRMKNRGSSLAVMAVFISVWVTSVFGKTIGNLFFQGNSIVIMVSVIFSVIIFLIIFHFSPAKTEKGVATKEYLLGLKDYLQIAEKDRLIFHNAPEKKPEVFEKLLPYAMVLGVADIWAKEFEGIYTTPPSWYSGPNNGAFSAVIFTHSISDFNSYASTISSAPGGSGGGGGGSSGGGGGGGGGGGW